MNIQVVGVGGEKAQVAWLPRGNVNSASRLWSIQPATSRGCRQNYQAWHDPKSLVGARGDLAGRNDASCFGLFRFPHIRCRIAAPPVVRSVPCPERPRVPGL
jgi:hypothetical protein